MRTRHVRHISGIGEVFRVITHKKAAKFLELDYSHFSKAEYSVQKEINGRPYVFCLPVTEYRPCFADGTPSAPVQPAIVSTGV